MEKLAFINGRFVPLAEANVSIMDRGFLFADGVYEVSAILGGRLVELDAHLARLGRSLEAMQIRNPYSVADWARSGEDLVRRNQVREGMLYMQVTRGAPETREFGFPGEGLQPTTVMFTQEKILLGDPRSQTGATVVTVPDLRWKRRDIKSVSLLAQVLAKQAAIAAGATEAWMVEDGYVTEGSATSAFIVTKAGKIVTRQLSNLILPGVTRHSVLQLARDHALTFEERAFTVQEAHDAAEAFLTSALQFVRPVISIDGTPIGDGMPGRMTERLREMYVERITEALR